MRDTNGLIGIDGDIGYEKPLTFKTCAGLAVAGIAAYAAFSFFGDKAIIAAGAATIGVIAGIFLTKR